MVPLNRPFFPISSWLTMLLRLMFICYIPHLLLLPSHFQNSLSNFSIERINGIPLWDSYTSDFQRALKIIIIPGLFIVMTTHHQTCKCQNIITVIMWENVHSRSYVLTTSFHVIYSLDTTLKYHLNLLIR